MSQKRTDDESDPQKKHSKQLRYPPPHPAKDGFERLDDGTRHYKSVLLQQELTTANKQPANKQPATSNQQTSKQAGASKNRYGVRVGTLRLRKNWPRQLGR